jgi:hypothetical protein
LLGAFAYVLLLLMIEKLKAQGLQLHEHAPVSEG